MRAPRPTPPAPAASSSSSAQPPIAIPAVSRPVCGRRWRHSVADVDAIPLTIEWMGDHVRLIDQRRLPGELVFVEARTVDQLCDAIATLAVRGAPALGVAGAMGV